MRYGDHHAPAGHVPGPLYRMDTDIGAAIDGDDTVAVITAPQIEERQQRRDIARVVACSFKQLVADAEAGVVGQAVFVESIDDHGAVLG
jgi:hypothetical protein